LHGVFRFLLELARLWELLHEASRPKRVGDHRTTRQPGVALAGETEVREVMKMPLGMLARAALAMIGKFPAEEVSSNLRRLKQVMETGRVTDTSYAIASKFSEHYGQ
jgi:hypothetical protein